MIRSIWKPVFYDKHLLRIFQKKLNVSINTNLLPLFEIRSRRSSIRSVEHNNNIEGGSYILIGSRFGVYNGSKYFCFNITTDHSGAHFGEYSFTKVRTKKIHHMNKIAKKLLKKKNLALAKRAKAKKKKLKKK